ncbi:MAG: hypothetical protein JNL21_34060 [Myxococcales bacterium]|nr:hypothetical protein [Myxococcales bacterium]
MGAIRRRAVLVGLAAAALGCREVPPPIPEAPGPKEPGQAGESGRAELLAGHLLVTLPAGAIDEPRRTSIMAAPQSTTDESRVVLEGGGPDGLARFVMMASELYLLGSGDLRADASRLVARGERVVELGDAKVPLFVIEPTAEPLPDRPVFVLGAVVGSPDGSLQEVTFFILPEMLEQRAEYADRARAIVKTLAAGPRKLEARGGPASFGKTLEADLPPGFLVTSQPGPDFEVYRARKLTKAGDRGATLGIYLGGHPALQHTQAARDGGPEPPATSEDGTLLEQKTTWVVWTTKEGVKVKETVLKLGEHEAVHVFALAGTDEDLATLMKIASSLRRA